MNIIQLQDRLKGLPEEALVKYVEQPMGEVPIYLALGELQRRSEMKKRFQASQADKPSVAEQLVAEAKPMQMGLGAMTGQRMMPGAQGVGAPQPTPEIDPRQMAASGIAANPQSAVGGRAMMKEGGIVGYALGGSVQPEGYGMTPFTLDQYYIPDDIEYEEYDPKLNRMVKKKVSFDAANKDQYTGKPIGSAVNPGVRGDGFIPFGTSAFVGDTYGRNFKRPKLVDESAFETPEYKVKDDITGKSITMPSLSNEEAEKLIKEDLEQEAAGFTSERQKLRDYYANKNKPKPTKPRNENLNNNPGGDGIITPEGNLTMEEIFGDFRKTPEQRRDEYRELQALYGMDPNFFEDARKKNIDMSLIEAGLRIAGGTSANPLENISAGATPALQSFAKEQSKLSGAQRLENLAAMKAYQDSEAVDKALAVDLYKAQQTAAAARGVSLQSARKTAMELAQQDMKDNYGGQQMSVYFRENTGVRQQLLDKLFNYHLNVQLGIEATPVDLFMPYGTKSQAEFNADLDKQFEEILGKK
tara:strand:+ start:714 stop:2297 length:1584 start_codon:yes stop_codon:yes gene_type:complete